MIGPVDLRPDHLETVQRILAEYAPNAPVQVFGSRANWTAKPYSDLDLILRVGGLTPDDAALAELSDAFSESELPFKVDLILDTGKPWDFLSLVQGGAVPLPWPTTPLGALVPDDRSICYGVVQPGSPDPLGRPILRVNNFDGNGLNVANAIRISPAVEDQYRRSRLQGGELLVTLVGSVGLTAIAPPELEGWNVARAVGVVPLAADVDALWVNHMMRSDAVRAFIAMRSNTTVQTTFNLKDLAEIPIPMPPDRVRRSMSELLSAFDDKIELNRRVNETLEASAGALFRDWFVDFGPTRAKVEGRPAYLAPDLWCLFPDRVENNGVPEGWSETPLDEIADFLNGLALQKFPAAPGRASLPVIKISELRAGVSSSSNRASTEVPARYIVGDGDFLFSWSGSLLAKFWTEGAGVLNQHLFKVTSKSFPAWFFSHWVWHHLAEFQAIAASKATTMGHIQRVHLSAAKTITPPPDTLARMSEVMQPLLDQIIGNLLESRTLAATRDALLPKLVSGELRVRDAEALAA